MLEMATNLMLIIEGMANNLLNELEKWYKKIREITDAIFYIDSSKL